MATPYRGKHTAEATAEASLDAFPLFFCIIYFYVYAGSAKKVGVQFNSLIPPKLTVFLSFFLKIAKIEPHYTCKIENEDTNSLAIENYSPELQIENLSADIMETGPSSGVIVFNILDVTDFNFYNNLNYIYKNLLFLF